jgi:hypothetical protein
MTTPGDGVDLDALVALAEAVPEWNWTGNTLWITDYDPSDPTGETAMQRPVGGADGPWAEYLAACDPATVLGLVERAKEANRLRAAITALADELETDRAGNKIFTVNVIHRFRALLSPPTAATEESDQ